MPPFSTLTPRLQEVAKRSLVLSKSHWGGNGLKIEEAIDSNISWTPTFFVKPNKALIVGVEVSDVLYPELLKIAAHDIGNFDFPVAVYQACSLEVYQKDPKLANVNRLRANGFGIITVDDQGQAQIQARAEPLAQHIVPDKFDKAIAQLTLNLKVRCRTAYATYQTSIGQGLQECGQLVEALIMCIARQAEAAGKIPAGTVSKPLADVIDELYKSSFFHNYRAPLGGARLFVKDFRNIASHPAKTAAEHFKKIQGCKNGFLEGLRIAEQLRGVIQAVNYKVKIV